MIAWEESPRQFKMSKQLDEGKFGEDLARKFLNDPIIKVNHGISHYDDVTQDKSYQDKDTDFIVWKKNVDTSHDFNRGRCQRHPAMQLATSHTIHPELAYLLV